MRAYIISIGSELMQGALTDSNATYLARELIAKGIELIHTTHVGDDLGRLTRTIERAASEADLVICTGGVGPTDDDLTREAIAAYVGETPVVDAALLETIRAFCSQRGIEMPERNAKQAWIIPSAEQLPNPVGTAPGWFVRTGSTVIVAMPGVPREMFRMWREQARPRITPLLPNRAYRTVNIRTIGIGESAAAQALGDLTKQENPYVGTYAKDDGVHITVTANADTENQAGAMLAGVVDQVRELLGPTIYTEDSRTLAQVLLDHLRTAGAKLGIAESGSGGRFAALLEEDPGCGDVVLGALVLPMGTDDAAALADRARTTFGASLGVGITVAAQPVENGVHEGTVTVAVRGKATADQSFPIRAAYAEVQRRSGMHAADVMRKALLGFDDPR
ncbi:MAG: molybdopterin-binding protein [Chloroflexota bacterium]